MAQSFSSRFSEICFRNVAVAMLALLLHACTCSAANVASIPVLCYHQLNADDNSIFSVTSAQFTTQMSMLRSLGYDSVSPQQYVAWLNGDMSTLPPKPILITFDDNILNSMAATAILTQYNYRAVMFTVTGYAD